MSKCLACTGVCTLHPPCPHQWQPIEGSTHEGAAEFTYKQRKDGKWFRMPLPPLPEDADATQT